MSDFFNMLFIESSKARYADAELRDSEARKERDAAWAALQNAYTIARNRQDSAG